MGRKRDKMVEYDRLRSLMKTVVDQLGGKLRPVLRSVLGEAGIDVNSKEGRAAYQAINRWYGGREAGTRIGKPAEGKPADYFPRTLKSKYRIILFTYIRSNHKEEYIKRVPPREIWITPDELVTWLEDFQTSSQPGEPIQE